MSVKDGSSALEGAVGEIAFGETHAMREREEEVSRSGV